ncbi:MAG TPA: S9 family peptidase [Burkholderiaceae bacterium]
MSAIARATRRLLAVVLAAMALSSPVYAQSPAQIPAEHFFSVPRFMDASLSPDGRHVAARIAIDGTNIMLAIFPVDSDKPTAVIRTTSDVGQYRWISDARLVYTLTDYDVADGAMMQGSGLYATNLDGTGQRQLAYRRDARIVYVDSTNRNILPSSTRLLGNGGKQDGEHIYVTAMENDKHDGITMRLLKLNTRTGRALDVAQPGRVTSWMLDADGEPRLATTADGGKRIVHYREADGSWRKLAEFERYGMNGDFEPVVFSPDGTLYVKAHQGRDKAALFAYDVKTGKMADKPLIELEFYDFNGSPIFRDGKLIGIHYLADAPGTAWLNDKMKTLQQQVDAMLPGTYNLIGLSRRGVTPYVLVNAMSDRVPGSSYLLNTETGKVRLLGHSREQIKPEQMAERVPVRYRARDGLEIPAYLTLPVGGARKNLPLVVYVHGGPWVRGGTVSWSGKIQFLASRGYAVLEPEFRGSTGYGDAHMRASFKQWGLTMQDDLADGARWAVAQGYADPNRICIAGGSYGGYAALMGLVKDGDLFRCAVSYAGVSDINLKYEITYNDVPGAYKQYGMPGMVGDPVADAAQFKATSPLLQAARIKRPVLLAHGTADRRVPIEHSTRFLEALRKTNGDVEWLKYEDEGHGFRTLKNQVDFWTRVDTFLRRHIGAPATLDPK